MSDTLAEGKSLFTSVRAALAISGIVALIAGVVVLVWPGKSAVLVTGILAAYLVIAGIVYVGLGIFSGRGGGWARIGHVALGLLYIAAGVIAFANLAAAAATLALVVVVFIGISWIVDGVVSLSLLGRDSSRIWTLLYAVLSIVAGIYVLFNVLLAGLALWIFLGASLIVLGIAQIVRAITIGRNAENASSAPTAAAGTE
jgi:uncharacterized membrane protein HdeD (DUF308 family)